MMGANFEVFVFIVAMNCHVLAMDNIIIDPGYVYSNCLKPLDCVHSCKEYEKSPFRSIDGTCNNLLFPTAGAGNTPFERILKPDYADKVNMPRGSLDRNISTPHEISKELFHVEKTSIDGSNLTVLFMTFGQFLDHDMTFTPHASCSLNNCSNLSALQYPCFPIRFAKESDRCTPFGRSLPVCPTRRKKTKKPRNHINELTSFIDGSAVYGSFLKMNQRLRFQDGSGKMRLLPNGLLPFDTQMLPCLTKGGCSLVGDRRGDENIALTSMHTLWVREHNRIAIGLKRMNKRWDEFSVFETARKIVGAELQHIAYKEWIPKIVHLSAYKKYNPKCNPSIVNTFAAAAFRFGHSLVPNQFSQLNENFDDLFKPVSLQQAFFNRELLNKRGIEPTLFGLLRNKSSPVDMGLAFGLSRRLFVAEDKNEHMDLSAFNIQRGRDHGLPTYGEWRKFCNLKPVDTFDDLTDLMLPGASKAFRKLYKHPNDIDLFAAGLAEKHVDGLVVGETFSCVFNYQFTRLRDGDRYFYKNKFMFTPSQLKQIEKSSMARVLCDNLNGIVSVQPRAFESSNEDSNKRVECSNIPAMDLSKWRSYN